MLRLIDRSPLVGVAKRMRELCSLSNAVLIRKAFNVTVLRKKHLLSCCVCIIKVIITVSFMRKYFIIMYFITNNIITLLRVIYKKRYILYKATMRKSKSCIPTYSQYIYLVSMQSPTINLLHCE